MRWLLPLLLTVSCAPLVNDAEATSGCGTEGRQCGMTKLTAPTIATKVIYGAGPAIDTNDNSLMLASTIDQYGNGINQFSICTGTATIGTGATNTTCNGTTVFKVNSEGGMYANSMTRSVSPGGLTLQGAQADAASGAPDLSLCSTTAKTFLDDRDGFDIILNQAGCSGTPTAVITAAGSYIPKGSPKTIASNGSGTAATLTFTPTGGLNLITCNDTDGCTVTLGETSTRTGVEATIINVTANVVNLADTSGVSETAGAAALGQWDSIRYVYVTDRWVETGRSNN